MSIPFDLPVGRILIHAGRRIRFEGHLGDWILSFSDVRAGGPVQITDPKTGLLVLPTVEWVRQEMLAGRLVDPLAQRQSAEGRQKQFAGLDTPACIEKDPKSVYRFRWAWAALQVGIKRSDPVYAKFIELRAPDLAREDGLEPPTPSTLRRWVRRLEKGGARPSTLISLSGRLPGQSQLCSLDDQLVHDAAIYHWAEPRASIRDAEAYMIARRNALIAQGETSLPKKPPSYETVRLRVRSLESYDTWKTKYGKAAADKKFNEAGDHVEATRFGERVYFDGTELSTIAVFDDDWPLPAAKQKVVSGIDAYTLFAFPPAVFCGPYREEMSLQALRNVMISPEVSDEDLAEHPWLAHAYVLFSTGVPDNDRTLIGPGYISALSEKGVTIELPGIYDSDAKTEIENFWRRLKFYLKDLPGTIRGPQHQRDPRHDPVAEANLTRHQLGHLVLAFYRKWNTTPKACLGDRSPLDLVQESVLAAARQPVLPPDDVERALAKTVPDRILTADGLVYDGIRYRGDGIEQLLSDNFRKTPHSERTKGPAKCIVSIRTYEWDIDCIDVYDEHNGTYLRLYSTQPRYTCGLSRWEHDQYRKMARARRIKFKTEEQRVNAHIEGLRQIDETVHELPFRRRAAMAALYECEQIRRLSGKRAASPGFKHELPMESFQMPVATAERHDVPKPPPGPSNAPTRKKPVAAPKRPEGYYSRSGITAPPAKITGRSTFDWSQVGDEIDEDDDLGSGLPEDEE